METHDVAVIGAGPVGLAAAAHLILRGRRPVVLEAGPQPGAAVRTWGHVRLFTPWRYLVDGAARRLLEDAGWTPPEPDLHPTGHGLVEGYVAPLAAIDAVAESLRFGARVVSVSRFGADKLKSRDRSSLPFELRTVDAGGAHGRLLATSVIDASGTCGIPNPLGTSGLPALGEDLHRPWIDYGIPDVLSRDRDRFAGASVAVVGAGHSAFTVLLDLARLQEDEDMSIAWLARAPDVGALFGAGDADQLAERGRLGSRMRALAGSGRIRTETGFCTDEVATNGRGVLLRDVDGRTAGPFDRIVAATGFRPDLSLTSELRLELDPAVEAPSALAPLIDPNVHSCGTVPPHGHAELAHPEPGYYSVGMKSYGRAPTFLLLTGYEQVRSVVAAIDGDMRAADSVRLVLPETGVCSTEVAEPIPAAADGARLSSACESVAPGTSCA